MRSSIRHELAPKDTYTTFISEAPGLWSATPLSFQEGTNPGQPASPVSLWQSSLVGSGDPWMVWCKCMYINVINVCYVMLCSSRYCMWGLDHRKIIIIVNRLGLSVLSGPLSVLKSSTVRTEHEVET